MMLAKDMTEPDFIRYVRAYAMDHYEKGGWDEVVEAWTDGDILEYYVMGNPNKAFRQLAKTVKRRHDYAQDIRNTAF